MRRTGNGPPFSYNAGMKAFFSDINWKTGLITLFAIAVVGALLVWMFINKMGGFPWSEDQSRTYWTKNKSWMKTLVAEIDQGKPYSERQLTQVAKNHRIVDIQTYKFESGSYTIFVFSRVSLDNTMGIFYSSKLVPDREISSAPMSYTWSVWAKPLETNWYLIKGS